MASSQLVTYAIWFGSDTLTERQISRAFFDLWEETWKVWNLPPTSNENDQEIIDDDRFFEPWFKVGRCFYLLLAESHCSPGDICGFIKGNGLIGDGDEILAIRVDMDWYIPHQGLLDPNARQKIAKWQSQASRLQLVRRP